MPFRIEHSIINETPFIHLRNDEVLTATIIPSVGAMLHALVLKLNGTDFNIIDSYPPAEVTAESASNWFKGVKLSPWPCRIPDGKYRFSKKAYSIKKIFSDGSALHGLLFDKPFQLIDESASDENASVVMRYAYEAEDPGYPFSYDCQVKFTLHPNRLLEVETIVSNMGEEEIPIADGWHPYFQLGGKVDDWNMQFPAHSIIEFDSRLIPTGTLLPYSRFNETNKIGNIKLDNCFFLKVQEYKPVCSIHNPSNNLSVHFYTNPGYSYLQLFIPPHRNSIAIENLSSAPDSFNNHMGLINLKPGNTRSFRVFYQVEVQENI